MTDGPGHDKLLHRQDKRQAEEIEIPHLISIWNEWTRLRMLDGCVKFDVLGRGEVKVERSSLSVNCFAERRGEKVRFFA